MKKIFANFKAKVEGFCTTVKLSVESVLQKHFNAQVCNKIYLIKTFWWFFGGTMACFLLKAIIPDFIKTKLFTKKIDKVLQYIVDLLNGNTVLNYLVFALLAIGAAWFIHKLWRNLYFSLENVVVSVVLIICLHQEYWAYPVLPFDKEHSYLVLYTAFLVGIIIAELKKLLHRHQDIVKDYSKKGYSNDTPNDIPKSYDVRQHYADEVVKMLEHTDLGKESFAIAIVGRWGSGKSTFINVMKEAIGESMYQINFNPWNSKNSNDIITDFFNLLRERLIPIFSSLKTPIRKYSRLLTDIDVNPTVNNLLRRYYKNDDIESKKKIIENHLRYIDKPIAVFIDDVDRLGAGEIFELLRLIRNTAMFPNILYIITMDKEYVSQQISSLGMDGSLYLEKIFQLEINLPKMDSTDILQTLRQEILDMTTHHRVIRSILNNLTIEDINQILSVTPTFRSASRFARQFSTTYNFINDTLGLKHIDCFDLFLIELIHFYDTQTYSIMSNEMNALFNLVIDRQYNTLKYYLKEGVIAPYKKSQKDQERPALIKDKRTQYFLRKMFISKEYNRNSIQFAENYLKYFGYNTPLNRISDKEFDNFMSEQISKKNYLLNKWCFSTTRPILPESFFAHFSGYRIEDITTEKETKNFLTTVFLWLKKEYRDIDECYYLLPLIMIKTRYRKEIRDYAKSVLTEEILNLPGKEKHLKVTKILSHALWHGDEASPYIIDNEPILESIRKNISLLLSGHDYDNILLVQEDGNIINQIAEFFISNRDNEIKGDSTTSTQILIEELAKNRKSQNKNQAEQMFANIRKNNVYGHNKEEDLFNRIFGGKGIELYNQYLETCFEEPKITIINQ